MSSQIFSSQPLIRRVVNSNFFFTTPLKFKILKNHLSHKKCGKIRKYCLLQVNFFKKKGNGNKIIGWTSFKLFSNLCLLCSVELFYSLYLLCIVSLFSNLCFLWSVELFYNLCFLCSVNPFSNQCLLSSVKLFSYLCLLCSVNLFLTRVCYVVLSYFLTCVFCVVLN